MGLLLRMLMQVLLVGVIIISAVLEPPAAAAAQALPGCVDMCGNISIPYPFGIDDQPNLNCSRGGRFNLTCKDSTLMRGNFSIDSISVEKNQLEVQMPISKRCYDVLGNLLPYYYNLLEVRLPYYAVSNAMNTFMAVGCDTYAVLSGFRNQVNYATGCVSVCEGFETVESTESCSGIGCCQVEIPNDLTNFSVSVYSFNNHIGVWSFNPCSYAFLVEKDKFNFSSSYLANLPYDELSTVLDWAIRNETCEEAKNKPDYACHGNTECQNVSLGYRCLCNQGYQGNPYHPQGCKDIDECADSNLNKCTIPKRCVNTIGNYTCSCPKWKRGDGRKDSGGCVADVSQVIKVAIGVSSTSLGLLFLLIGAWWSYKIIEQRKKIKRKENFFKRHGGLELQQQLSSGQVNVENIKMFNSKELEEATNHFNVNRILGQGGQGTVYKGMLTDGRIVAVKKSKIIDEGKLEEFINEVVILSQINHRNVVKLLGCCLEMEVPLLVYEFIPNGTLFQYLNDQNEELPLTWDMRLQIAIEIAGALFYLHSAATSPIYHRDIKSTNILLDDKYRAKVADFGTSRSVAIDQTHLTTAVHGTFGYLDPEYFQSNQFTEKSDVYSFGVVLVELLTGQKAISSIRTQEGKSLATYFILSMKENRLFDILDPRVLKESGKEQIIRFGNLAKRCLNLNGKKRPTMKEVTMELKAIQMLQKVPTAQQNFEEIEYAKTEIYKAWDAASTSTVSGFDSAKSSSLDTQPFLSS